MTFRLRVLALVALVAVTATAVTAWLTLQQASQQVTESADAQREDVDLVTERLTEYGWTHATWERVRDTVLQLGIETGQRIKLTTQYGEVLVDTDTLEGRTARDVDSPPISINPRPSLELPEGVDERQLVMTALTEIDAYRTGVLLAACLTRAGVQVLVADGEHGVPRYAPGPLVGEPAAVENCHEQATVQDIAREEDAAQVSQCTEFPVRLVTGPAALADGVAARITAYEFRGIPRSELSDRDRQTLESCLGEIFVRRTEEVAPLPLYAYLGAVDEDPPGPLSPWPILAAAALVAALAVAGSLLVSRRVVQPIRALTGASYRLGKGDLSERVPVVGRDELAGLASSFNRMADSLQRGEERQRRLIADVAHELRTPLANLRGYLEALKDGVVRPDPELFASLYEEAVLQQRIVDDLQDLALAEAGTLVYHRSQVDLAELLETCRTAHQAVAEAAGVRLAVAACEPGYVEADPDRLRQVLGNLVGNALRATPAGGSVTLAAQRNGRSAIVTVADTGTGIAPEHLPHVFDRFWRADAARGRDTGGSGLGLAIARQIVTDHGGTIEASSAPGSGSTFTIRLPIDPAAPQVPLPRERAGSGWKG
jgi:two-component system sensor histidine kinase BaeS